MSDAAKRGLTIFLIGLVLLIGGLVAEYLYLSAPGSDLASLLGSQATGSVSVGGPFTLVDQNGVTRRPEDFRGKFMLIYFGYTYCPDVCPTTLQAMSEALEMIGETGEKEQPIFITIDPERDTQEHLKGYAANFHPRLLALTGSPEQIAEAAHAYKVFYQPVKQDEGGYLMDHSSIVYFMDREGHYIAHFSGNVTAAQMAPVIAKHL